MENKKITKADIENLANEIMEWVKEKAYTDVSIYYNNKRMHIEYIFDDEWNIKEIKTVVEEDICPFDYFEYVNTHHIISMSFEGVLCHVLNEFGEEYYYLQSIFSKYDMYFELGNSWNMTVYCNQDDDHVEYTDYSEREKSELVDIYNMYQNEILIELRLIAKNWYDLSSSEKDTGSCVIGAGFIFDYNEEKYKLHAQSCWQGSLTWEKYIDVVKNQLEFIGAKNITYDWGRMD